MEITTCAGFDDGQQWLITDNNHIQLAMDPDLFLEVSKCIFIYTDLANHLTFIFLGKCHGVHCKIMAFH